MREAEKIIKTDLTKQSQERYSRGVPRFNRGGDNFMLEPGQGEHPQGPKEPSVSDATKRIEEITRQREAKAQSAGGGNRPPEKPPAPPTAEDAPDQEAAGGKREEAGDVEAHNQTKPSAGEIIDKTGITNGSLLRELAAIDSLIGLKEPEEILTESLQRISEIQEGKTPEEREKFQREKETVIGRVRREAFTARGERLKQMKESFRAQGLYGERKLTENEKEQIKNAKKPEDIEKLFNRMFDRVDSRPQADFQTAFGSIGAFEHDEFVKTLNEAITENNDKGNTVRAKELTLIVQQYANERAAREIIHNAYYGVLAGLDTEKISNFIDSFLSGYADMAFGKGGVTQAMHFYEQALLITREEAGGYLKPAEVVGEMKTNSEGKVNVLARKLLNDSNEGGLIKNSKGEVIKLEPWQIDRALAFARGMSIITGRTIEIAASSILPPGLTAFTDQYAQRIIAEMAPFRHSFKFYAGSKFSRVLSYTMNRGRKPWTTQDIKDMDDLKFEEQMNVLNAIVPEGKERFYSVLNPLEIGGILSRTGWRIAGGGVTMIDDLVSKVKNPDEAWIGTGVQIERKRGGLVKGNKEAADTVKDQLKKMGERTPLRLFLNLRSLQKKVLDGYLKDAGIDVDIFVKNDSKELDRLRLEQVKKLQLNFDELVLLQEKANQTQQSLDTLLNGASEATRSFTVKIREIWNGGEKDKFFKTLKEKEWATPYTFGTDDVPYDRYSFETTGMRSIARRWGDMKSAAGASKALGEFVSEGIEHFSNQEQIVEAMRKIYVGIKGYNEEDAKKFVLKMAEGVMKFYGKDYKARLPLGIGTLMGMITGKSSYAQIAYGRGAMAWDELQLNEFTRLLRNSGMLTIEQQHELQSRAGGGRMGVSWGYTRTVIPLLSLALAYYMLSQVMKEER